MKKQVIINNLLLNYYFFPSKNEADQTLIFLHGWGMSSRHWFKIAEKLKKFNIYLIDLPGFGDSQLPPKSFDVKNYKNTIKEFVKKMAIKKAVFIGHSFGGRITIKLAAENPDFLEKIVLVNTAGVVTASTLKKIASVFAKLISPIFRPVFMQPLRKKLYSVIDSEYLENEQLSKIFSNVVSEDLIKHLSAIKIPALIIWGRNDKITPLNFGLLMKEEIKNSKLVILENAGHFSFLDQPDKFNKLLIDFIN